MKIGDESPDFRLPDHTGGYVRLSDHKGKSNVVIAVYPAAFTPVWSEEMRAFDADTERFRAEDTHVLGISVDYTAWATIGRTVRSPESTASCANKASPSGPRSSWTKKASSA